MRQTEAQAQHQRDRAERIQAAQLADVAALMNLPAFRRYAKRYLTICNVFTSTFTGNSETFFKEGRRAVGTTMFGEIMQTAPERFAELMAEPMPDDETPDPDDD
jgi:hypothetical protein